MGHKYQELAFTERVRAEQTTMGSRATYARREGGDADVNDRLGPSEADFIGRRDSFYMATVGETGWPYIQHRGGPEGFVRILDEKTLGFADFAGNRQYISVGNLAGDDRVSLFFMDYANRTRLKLLGRARTIGRDDVDVIDRLVMPGYKARVERGLLITVEAFDWNCSQHITQRFTAADVEHAVAPLRQRLAELEALLGEKSTVRP